MMKIRVALIVMLLIVSVAAVLNGTMASDATVPPIQSITLSQLKTSFTFSHTKSIFSIPPDTIPPDTTFFTVPAKSETFFTVPLKSSTTIVITTSTTVSTDTWGYGWNYGNGYYTTACSYYGCYNSNCYYNCYNQQPNNCYPGYPNYPYCSPSYGYQVPTTTTATAYSLLTETSTTTQTTVSTPNPIFITNTLTTTTTDTTMETLYGSLMAIFLVLFLATLFLLVRPRSEPKADPMPVQSQPAYVRTSYKCSACGNEILPKMKFCGDCGAQLKREALTQ